ncbi:MAG: 4,5-DOPA dioxygenase extradiol [Galactobacillus timonensis]|uniref:4,5-DOPA-extradiol-dioxygenase n=1 Tax=Galactobacillus timonensis TaxID=2041840 RepID=UPI002409556C|nr:4,5-DOPA dioxygenase extradiol [Galactobacillus timonensis]MDD5852099.1 4,5-DOPA dioxygenase extradiol [Galactobacillus timonensis]MDD6600491.1 4,5-DOPA dioxygenase extradiol [Galactobacillus timonensis]
MMRTPVIFSGHGSPMIALEHNEITSGMEAVGRHVIDTYGKPKAILAVSAHWYTRGTFTQSAAHPSQIYDMYGFPEELYRVKYPVSGNRELTDQIVSLLGSQVSIDDSWGIDHGTWTVLVHMFPKADIPVVQLSVDGTLTPEQCFETGKKLASLRDEGYLIFGSGNIVHNLRRVEWDNPDGTEMTHAFNDYIINAVTEKQNEKVIHYTEGPEASYAVPTPDHYLPLVYCLGAAGDDSVREFNNVCNLGSMAMTGFLWSSEK